MRSSEMPENGLSFAGASWPLHAHLLRGRPAVAHRSTFPGGPDGSWSWPARPAPARRRPADTPPIRVL